MNVFRVLIRNDEWLLLASVSKQRISHEHLQYFAECLTRPQDVT